MDNRSAPDALIFDLDGTLWDASEPCALAWSKIAKGFGISHEISTDEIGAVTGLPNEECIRRVFPDVNENTMQSLINILPKEELSTILQRGGILYSGVTQGLHQLAKVYPLFIVSNCQAGYIEAFMDFHHLSNLFRDTECWGRTGEPKEENLRKVIHRNNLKRPVMIGDTISDANAAMINKIEFWYASYGFGKVNGTRCEFTSFPEIVEYALGTKRLS